MAAEAQAARLAGKAPAGGEQVRRLLAVETREDIVPPAGEARDDSLRRPGLEREGRVHVRPREPRRDCGRLALGRLDHEPDLGRRTRHGGQLLQPEGARDDRIGERAREREPAEAERRRNAGGRRHEPAPPAGQRASAHPRRGDQ